MPEFTLHHRYLVALGFILASAFFTDSSSVHAESTNKRILLPGGRAQAMGGAFTAIADDASAAWYNPAGLGRLDGPGFSLTVNNYSRSRKEISGIKDGTKISDGSSSVYPGFAGGYGEFGGLTLGWSYFTLEHQNTDESQILNIAANSSAQGFTYKRSELTTGNLICAGVSAALPLGRYLSLGVSEFYYRRQKQSALKESSSYLSGTFYDSFVRQSTSNEGMLTSAGILFKGPNLSLGLSARIPVAMSDRTVIESEQIVYTGSTPERSNLISNTRREDETPVRTWTLGIAYKPAPWLSLSSDILHYPATKTPWPSQGGYDTKAVTDWSLGFELSGGMIVFSGGVFSNSSLVSTPVPSITTSQPARIDYRGMSAGLGLKTKQSETLLIMVRQSGRGKAQLVQGDLSLQDISIETESFSFATRYKF
jgi:hypothetical protein